mgnify:CR=1 FL=1
MEKVEILEVFITQLNDFFEDICKVFEGDKNIIFASNAIYSYSCVNPKKLVELWRNYAVIPYRKQIDEKDFTFFIEKDYTNDLLNMTYKDSIINKLDELRGHIKNMNDNNRNKALKYVENLVKLCDLYYQE